MEQLRTFPPSPQHRLCVGLEQGHAQGWVLPWVSRPHRSLHAHHSHGKWIRADQWVTPQIWGFWPSFVLYESYKERKGFGGSSGRLGGGSPCWNKARRTGDNWVLPSMVQGANSIDGDSKLPRFTSSLIIYCLLLGKGPLFAYLFMI